MQDLVVKIQTKLLGVRNIPPSQVSKEIETIKEFLADTTKISLLLIVIVRSIFREHEQDVLTEREVQEILDFLRDMWFRLEEDQEGGGGGGSKGKMSASWKRQVHKALNAKHSRRGYKFAGQREARYRICHNFLNHYMGERHMHITDKHGKIVHRRTLIHLIHKLLYFSN